MKLFAVAVLASASSAQAGNAARTVDWNGFIDPTAIKPRELANGRPAGGNTVGKTPGPAASDDFDRATPEQERLLTASLAYQAAVKEPVIQPRLLANFRPACGNTGGKSDAPDDCTTAEIRAVDAYNKAYSENYSKHYAKVNAAYEKLMVATTAAVTADPTLKARLLIGGRPACGNTMSKKGPPAYCRISSEKN
jgi:uncharacterized protein YecT (DUF1311 family)